VVAAGALVAGGAAVVAAGAAVSEGATVAEGGTAVSVGAEVSVGGGVSLGAGVLLGAVVGVSVDTAAVGGAVVAVLVGGTLGVPGLQAAATRLNNRQSTKTERRISSPCLTGNYSTAELYLGGHDASPLYPRFTSGCPGRSG
jgi:hypothetical protein